MTGANRGLGYAFARQLAERDIHVATARNLAQANNVASTGILVNSASARWFRTDIGGPNAPRRPGCGHAGLVGHAGRRWSPPGGRRHPGTDLILPRSGQREPAIDQQGTASG